MNTGLSDHFTKTLEEFPFDAPPGACGVDRYIETLARFRRSTTTIDVVRLRKGLWRAAYLAYLNETDRQLLPGWRDEAEKFLDHLRSITASMRGASHIDSDPIFRSLVFIPDDPKDLSQRLPRQMVEQEFYVLNAFLGIAHDRITQYLERNVLPRKEKGSNAADRFMRSFIDSSGVVWEMEIGKLVSRDQKAFSCLLFDALTSFGYPNSPGWTEEKLRERVRKQLFPKSVKE
jgi:hypothetical protein